MLKIGEYELAKTGGFIFVICNVGDIQFETGVRFTNVRECGNGDEPDARFVYPTASLIVLTLAQNSLGCIKNCGSAFNKTPHEIQ